MQSGRGYKKLPKSSTTPKSCMTDCFSNSKLTPCRCQVACGPGRILGSPAVGGSPSSAQPLMHVRADFERRASRWRQELEDCDEDGVRRDLASRWQRYSETAQMFHSATLTKVDTWQLVVEQREAFYAGNFGLETWVHNCDRCMPTLSSIRWSLAGMGRRI